MTTIHQYINKYPVSKKSEKLIVGTIHPHDHHNFLVPFFYGNKLSIWKILNEAFNNEMGEDINLDKILKFLESHKISVSDTIIECERTKPSALDKDLIPTQLNHGLINQIKNSNIKEIFFTSGFQKNNAFKLFYVDILGLKITPEIRNARQIILDNKIFGRPIKCIVLYSPSGSSNVPLSTSHIYLKEKHKYLKSSRPVYDFKVDYYRNIFTSGSFELD
jgi:G:T/U-mismatch repair DNA glycosylase